MIGSDFIVHYEFDELESKMNFISFWAIFLEKRLEVFDLSWSVWQQKSWVKFGRLIDFTSLDKDLRRV